MQSTSLMNTMLSWLKGFARMVLGLFDLAGENAFSPLEYLINHWKALLITIIIIGFVADIVIWLVRWRPHWVWFRKKRIVIDDDDYFDGEELMDANLYDVKLFDVGSGAPKHRSRRRDSSDSEFFNTSYSKKDVYGSDKNEDIFTVDDIKARRKPKSARKN